MSKHTKYGTTHKCLYQSTEISMWKTVKARDGAETFSKPCKSSNKVISYSPRVNKT